MEERDLEGAPDTEGAGAGADLPGSPSTSAAGTEAGDASVDPGTVPGPDAGLDPDPVDDAKPDTEGVG